MDTTLPPVTTENDKPAGAWAQETTSALSSETGGAVPLHTSTATLPPSQISAHPMPPVTLAETTATGLATSAGPVYAHAPVAAIPAAAPAPLTTISSDLPPPTYNPDLSTADHFRETGATAAPAAALPAETPGLPIPGSFPRTLSAAGRTDAGQTAQHAFASMTAALSSAASRGAQYLPQSVKETVAPYLPEGTSVTAHASEHDTVHATSYPSTELGGALAGESTGGVGALPGLANETGVAMPENLINRPVETQPPTLAERAAGYLPAGVQERVAPYVQSTTMGAASASDHDAVHQTSLPSSELTGAGTNERVAGAGALPGAVGETGVAQPESLLNREPAALQTEPTLASRAAGYLPQGLRDTVAPYVPAALAGVVVGGAARASEHDHAHGTSLPSSEATGAYPGERVGGAGALPGTAGETGVAKVPDERVGAERDAPIGNYAAARNATMGAAAAAAAAVSRGYDQAKDTATSYAPTSLTGATDNTKTTGATGTETALVPTSTAVAPHPTVSLPTTEAEGMRAGEHVGGVGALPGGVGETGVAVLPDEKNGKLEEAPHHHHHHHHRAEEAALAGAALGGAAYEGERHRERENVPSRVGEGPLTTGTTTSTAPSSYNAPSTTTAPTQARSSHRGEEALAGAGLGGAAAYEAERHHERGHVAGDGTTAPEIYNAPTGTTAPELYDAPASMTVPAKEHSSHRGEEALAGAGRGAAALEGERHREREHVPSRAGEAPVDNTTAPPSYTGSSTTNAPEKSHSHSHKGEEAAVAGAGLGAAAYEGERHREREHAPNRETAPVTTAPTSSSTAPTSSTAPSSTTAPNKERASHKGEVVAGAAVGAAAYEAERHHERKDVAGDNASTATGTTADTRTTAPSATTATTAGDAPAHDETGLGNKGLPPQDDAYKTDYHPAALHPIDADYSDVKLDAEGDSAAQGTEGTTGASAATKDKTANDNDVAGLKDGGDRKLHGGVPGDIGGGTMPVGDSHEGGVDSADPKRKAHAPSATGGVEREASTASHDSAGAAPHKAKFMDKVKGEIKVLSGKITNKPEKVEEGQRLKSGQA